MSSVWFRTIFKRGCLSIVPSGKYQDTPGQIKCKNCTTGHSIQTRTTCTTCHAGGYFDGYDCVACPTGYYSLAGDKSCTICTIGQYAKLDKDDKTFYNVTTSSGCFSCRPGLYGVAKGKVSETDACAKCEKEGLVRQPVQRPSSFATNAH